MVDSTSAVRDLRLGIDYGTSTSKLVIRDYAALGGERAYLIGKEKNCRFPSTVICTQDAFILGCDVTSSGTQDTVYQSVKMQVADEIKQTPGRFYYGPPREFPSEFLPSDLAVLSIWWLISEGERTATKLLDSSNFNLPMTLGIPMSFFADGELRAGFLRIARAASLLYREHGSLKDQVIRFSDARKWLDQAFGELKSRPAIPDDQISTWIRSEAESAMLWAFRSPSIPSGTYFKIDIGAGTTNASMFRLQDEPLEGRWVKAAFQFFGAYSGPNGMDAVDRQIALHLKLDTNMCLSLRGEEDRLLQNKDLANAVAGEFGAIQDCLKNAWRLGYPRVSGPLELPHWEKEASIFVIGGGSLVSSLRNFVSHHPNGNGSLEQRQSEIPRELYFEDGSRPTADVLPFAMVAYGLSNLSVPRAETPGTIPPMETPPSRRRPSHEDIYGDG